MCIWDPNTYFRKYQTSEQKNSIKSEAIFHFSNAFSLYQLGQIALLMQVFETFQMRLPTP